MYIGEYDWYPDLQKCESKDPNLLRQSMHRQDFGFTSDKKENNLKFRGKEWRYVLYNVSYNTLAELWGLSVGTRCGVFELQQM